MRRCQWCTDQSSKYEGYTICLMSRHLSQSWLMYHVQNISRLLATPTADKAILHLVLSPFLCRFSMGTWRFAPTVPTPTGSALQKRPPTRRRITWLRISRIDIVWKGFSSKHHLPQSALDQLADSRECSEHGVSSTVVLEFRASAGRWEGVICPLLCSCIHPL